MSKRFTDTDKYKKPFFRSLPGPYKLFWDYLYHDCNHAGIWHKDFQVAQIYLGQDMPINEADALMFFNNGEQRIEILEGGSKWRILPFTSFQYGDLNPLNRLHSSVLSILKKYENKPLGSPLNGAKDKDKDKDKDKEIKKRGVVENAGFTQFYKAYPKHQARQKALESFLKINPDQNLLNIILKAIEYQKKTSQWQKNNGEFIPLPATWLNQKRWEDEPVKSQKEERVVI